MNTSICFEGTQESIKQPKTHQSKFEADKGNIKSNWFEEVKDSKQDDDAYIILNNEELEN